PKPVRSPFSGPTRSALLQPRPGSNFRPSERWHFSDRQMGPPRGCAGSCLTFGTNRRGTSPSRTLVLRVSLRRTRICSGVIGESANEHCEPADGGGADGNGDPLSPAAPEGRGGC